MFQRTKENQTGVSEDLSQLLSFLDSVSDPDEPSLNEVDQMNEHTGVH